MPKFRKKPVEIEAFQLGSAMYLPDWFPKPSEEDITNDGVIIYTLEGNHLARWGDWIIKGVKGEFYPCKPDIFLQTYDPVE